MNPRNILPLLVYLPLCGNELVSLDKSVPRKTERMEKKDSDRERERAAAYKGMQPVVLLLTICLLLYLKWKILKEYNLSMCLNQLS